MIKGGLAGIKSSPRRRHWRILAVSAAALLLVVQIGLAVHGASHLHQIDETGDCNLCILNSHFVAESPAVPDLKPALPVGVFSHVEAENPADTTLQIPTARGPPAASV